ncbi:FAD binding domain-containing protein [Amycolatopsis jejuensis]|uniref:FAD binding domain-containing protein n=1 Tax=Amycolatopsis jejuensis TaxID=330084 RepID=UPI00052511C2|nr:FAD binding domain-containing protein [Amycolatopsis jejuensis]
MKPAAVGYRRAESIEHTIDLLAELGDDAKILAGGQSLVPMLNLRLARPSVLVDVSRVETGSVRRAGAQARLGATLRHRVLEDDPLVRELVPLFAACAPFIGYPAIRNRGTVGGSLSHADSHAELGVVAVTVDAEMVLRSRARGERRVPAGEFFVGPFMTVVEPDEMLTEVVVPVAEGEQAYFREIVERTGDFASAAIAATFRVEDGKRSEVRLGVAGLASTPVRLRQTESVLDDPAALGDAVDLDAASLGVDIAEKRYELSLIRALVREFAESTGPEGGQQP